MTCEIDALHALADSCDLAALREARAAVALGEGAGGLARVRNANDRFQLADHLRKLATRQQVAGVVGPVVDPGLTVVTYLQRARIDSAPVRHLLNDARAGIAGAVRVLASYGIRYLDDHQAIAIALRHRGMAMLMSDSGLSENLIAAALQGLPGARTGKVRIGGTVCHCTIVPWDALAIPTAAAPPA